MTFFEKVASNTRHTCFNTISNTLNCVKKSDTPRLEFSAIFMGFDIDETLLLVFDIYF